MQRAGRHAAIVGMLTGALVTLSALQIQAGDWGARLIGDLGGAPKSLAKTFFDASSNRFEYSSRGLELGVAWKDWDAGVFMYTVNKGYLQRDYSSSACGPWRNGTMACTPNGQALREGIELQAVGVRLVGVRVGRFVNIARPYSWLRFGVPVSYFAMVSFGAWSG